VTLAGGVVLSCLVVGAPITRHDAAAAAALLHAATAIIMYHPIDRQRWTDKIFSFVVLFVVLY
jgi:hypothetical protein